MYYPLYKMLKLSKYIISKVLKCIMVSEKYRFEVNLALFFCIKHYELHPNSQMSMRFHHLTQYGCSMPICLSFVSHSLSYSGNKKYLIFWKFDSDTLWVAGDTRLDRWIFVYIHSTGSRSRPEYRKMLDSSISAFLHNFSTLKKIK